MFKKGKIKRVFNLKKKKIDRRNAAVTVEDASNILWEMPGNKAILKGRIIAVFVKKFSDFIDKKVFSSVPA